MIGTKHRISHSSAFFTKYGRVYIVNITGQAIINPIGIAIMNKLEPSTIITAFKHLLRETIASKSY